MHGSRIDIFYKIFVTRFRTFGPYSAASLSTEFTKRRTLDVSHVGDGNDHLIICIEVFRIEFFGGINDICFTFISVLVLDFLQLVFDDFHTKIVIF